MVPLSRKQSNSSVELSLELYSVLKKEYCNYYNIILKSNLLFKIDKPSSHLSHRSVTKLASPIHTLWEYKQYVKFKREWKHSRVTLSLTVQLSIKGIPIISINSRNYGLFEFLRKTHLFLLREVYPTACGTLKFLLNSHKISFILFYLKNWNIVMIIKLKKLSYEWDVSTVSYEARANRDMSTSRIKMHFQEVEN